MTEKEYWRAVIQENKRHDAVINKLRLEFAYRDLKIIWEKGDRFMFENSPKKYVIESMIVGFEFKTSLPCLHFNCRELKADGSEYKTVRKAHCFSAEAMVTAVRQKK